MLCLKCFLDEKNNMLYGYILRNSRVIPSPVGARRASPGEVSPNGPKQRTNGLLVIDHAECFFGLEYKCYYIHGRGVPRPYGMRHKFCVKLYYVWV